MVLLIISGAIILGAASIGLHAFRLKRCKEDHEEWERVDEERVKCKICGIVKTIDGYEMPYHENSSLILGDMSADVW